MTEIAVSRKIPVIVCSSDSSDRYEKYFQHGVNLVIRGEGEMTLIEVLKALTEKRSLEDIPGIALLLNGRTVITQGAR